MAINGNITSKAQLAAYCLRKCGAPVIEINIDDQQIDDRINDALEFMQEYQFDFIRSHFVIHEVTQTDVDNKYVELPPAITGVYQVLKNTAAGSASTPLFNVEYQLRLNDLYDLSSVNLSSYFIAKQYLSQLNDILNVQYRLRYRKDEGKMFIDTDWATNFKPGDFMIIECGLVLEPENIPKLWGHLWLRQYAAALIKKQWGENLTKMSGIRLPNGVQLDAEKIIEQADKEIDYIRTEFILKFQEPDEMYVG